ncbi:DUF4345 domain-containing protein [Aureibaculum sp. 2210JD6-5]|uniref:DUF4345 domain-containing protein n=1 Tax=Aureibaculum sp. 2210JD6-5 TaxID=3103957 RepID=UPI002AAE533D|nr:DUF4345 domain-containing protein [Aureibaculum sp. 2210JD6-5]MDY7395817.1 DUF4345 domain-containing protein [Aureibaculum sp. 2210JD6-5]
MIKTKADFINKIHLIISVLIVVPVAFIYGFKPELNFDIYLQTVDEHNQFKAIMGLYLGFSTLWLLGIFKANYLKIAIITNIIFMLGLGFGRVISISLDGAPTSTYVFGIAAELLLGFYGVWVWSRIDKNPNLNF